jgi:hypothetical protein
MAVLKGLDCFVYRNTATYASPTWSIVNPVIEVTIDSSVGTIDASNRNSTYRLMLAGLLEWSATIKFNKDKDDTDFVALETAANGRTNVDLLILDGVRTSTASTGFRVQGFFSSWNESQPLEGAIEIDATIVPAAVSNPIATFTGAP